ncbi:hypothetical protein QUC31_012505 [Theobroma cacao]
MALVRVPSSFPSILPSVFPKKLLSVSSSFPISCSSKSTPNQVKNNDDNSNIDNPKGPKRLSEQSSWQAKDSEGRDYLYRLGKEADNMNIAVGARAGVIDDLFAGNFLGRDLCHIVKNFLAHLLNVKIPLILGIWGGKGQGKSFQTELIFQAMGIEPVIMSAGELESERAGEPGKLIRERYRTASQVVQNQVRSFTTLILDIFKETGSSSTSRPMNIRATSSMLTPKARKSATKAGESSLSFCEICAERKERRQMFPISGCSHSFCSDCISMHVRTKLEGNISIIMCPGDCRVILELEACRPLLPKEVVNLWEDLLCEELLCATGGRLYCPFKDCSALLLNDNQGEVIAECECPFCLRLFCAQCHVPWHLGIDCEEYQNLTEDERGREDLMVRKLVK